MRQVKYLAMLLIALFCSTTINAQGIKIYQKSGEAIEITYTDIDSIVAYGDNSNKDKYEAVDLGLSVKWATFNVGATAPEEIGDYFAWGEIAPKSDYSRSTYTLSISGSISGNPEYDAATANWGEGWRMPTKAEFKELIDECVWEWKTVNGVNGYEITGAKGNTIFIPATGYKNGTTITFKDDKGAYWSGTPYNTMYGSKLSFKKTSQSNDFDMRYYGLAIRPVKVE